MSALPASGWFRDPGHRDQERWWNGTDWTDQVRKLGPQPRGAERGVDPVHGIDTHLLQESAFWIFTARVDGEYTPHADAAGIERDDAHRRRARRRHLLPAIALAALAMVAGPFLVFLVPLTILVVVLLWFVRGGGTARQRAALTRWAVARGLTDDGGRLLFGDQATKHPAGDLDETIRGLRAAGMRFRGRGGARVRGSLWRAAPGATIQSVRGRPEYRRDAAPLTVVSIPLPPEVAMRYRGVATERPRQERSFQLREWQSLPFGPEDTPPSHVTVHPQQRDPDRLILLGIPVLERVKQVPGWVVTDGRLTAWTYGDLLAEVSARHLALEAGEDPGDHALAEDRMVQFLRGVSDLHEVVLGA